jgi:hypothetical protein
MEVTTVIPYLRRPLKKPDMDGNENRIIKIIFW